jgi:hypothetical protein
LKNKFITYSIWIIIAYLSLEAYRVFIDYGIKQNKVGVFHKLNEVFTGNTAYDLVILGSSRAESHISPVLLDSGLGVNAFNLGIPGSYMHQQMVFLNSYLVHHPQPKTILLSIDIHGYKKETDYDLISDYNRYFPYLNQPVFYKEMKVISPRYFYYKHVAAYSLAFDKKDENLNYALRGYFNYNKHTLSYYKGFAFSPYEKNGSDTLKKELAFESLPPRIIWNAWENLTKFCEKHKIKLIVVFTPLHKNLRSKILNQTQLRTAIKQIFKNNVCLDYTMHNMSDASIYFSDPTHLNQLGAAKFSQILTLDLKQFLDKKNVK